MSQDKSVDSLVDVYQSEMIKSIEYETFISCLADIMLRIYKNKDIDKHFI